MNRKLLLLITLVTLVVAGALVACAGAEPAATAECPEAEPCPDCPTCEEGVVDVVPFEAAWAGSPHADAEAEAFNHWNEDDPAEVEAACATCHAASGYLDFLGADGTEPGVDGPAEIGQVITCEACHNSVASDLTEVTFPSGAVVENDEGASRCMVCHQGRASGADVDAAIEGLDLDTASEDLGFINIHYYAAAATLYGSEVGGGYEYAGMAYQVRFGHVDEYDSCADCHDPHSLEVQVAECAHCHEGVESVEDLRELRMESSLADYDGDGDVEEGISYEIAGLQDTLYMAMQAYGEQMGTPIAYDSHAYPYFFNDSNGDGEAGEDEANYGNQYSAWTPRLLQAAYNYQVVSKDPGGYAHNAKYQVALLYDSIMDLNSVLDSPVEMAGATRNDPGHFDGTAEAFRHWDEDGAVPGSCAKCHSADGVEFFLAEGVNVSTEPANSFSCSTCHTFGPDGIGVLDAGAVEFPSGAEVTFGEGNDSNLCLLCHQGRSSTTQVNAAIDGLPADTPSEDLGFLNVHYFAAGATLFGSEAQGAYQYDGKTYAGAFEHVENFNTCADCHNVHALEVEVETCERCHGSADPSTYRNEAREGIDYDGDGDVEEGVAGEIATLNELLYAEILAYSANTVGTPIVYDSHAYPYFFVDTNGNGESDPDEANYGNQYTSWTPRLLQAAYNYQYIAKDPGGFAHNGTYELQVLYDSIESLNPAAVAGLTRP